MTVTGTLLSVFDGHGFLAEEGSRVSGEKTPSDLCIGPSAVYVLGAWPLEKREGSYVAFEKEL